MPPRGPRAPKAPQGEPCGCSGRCGDHWTDMQIAAQVVQGGQKMKVFGQKPGPGDITRMITAVAIALTESGGYTQACNHNLNGSYDRGLFQINDVWGNLSDYRTDATNMWTVFLRSGKTFKAWNGDLVRRVVFIPRATTAVRNYLKSLGQVGGIGPDPLFGNPLGPGFPNFETGGDCAMDGCIHGVCLGPVHFCADVLLGGLKVAAGGIVLAIAGLAILFLTARELGEATGARGGLRLARTAVKATPAGRAYKVASKVKPRSEAARTRTTVARTQARSRATVARERRRTVAVRERAATRKARYRARAAEARSDSEIARASFRQERYGNDYEVGKPAKARVESG